MIKAALDSRAPKKTKTDKQNKVKEWVNDTVRKSQHKKRHYCESILLMKQTFRGKITGKIKI